MANNKDIENELGFNDYIDKISMPDLLESLDYKLVPRSGRNWLVYGKMDSSGTFAHGDKFIVNHNGKTCFDPNEPMRPDGKSNTYNIISFITSHRSLFPENASIENPYRLVHVVCRRILSIPEEQRHSKEAAAIVASPVSKEPFDLDLYTLTKMRGGDFESAKPFYSYFRDRGLSYYTQMAFRKNFCLATRRSLDGAATFTNLSFPMSIPGDEGKVVGFEERGRSRSDGSSGYKGMAPGSEASRGVWIANLSGKPLSEAENIYWFESAYDAMAFYQLKSKGEGGSAVRKGVFVSTSGSPGYNQFAGMLAATPSAQHHLCFDNDLAGRRFTDDFRNVAYRSHPLHKDNVPSHMAEYVNYFRTEKFPQKIKSPNGDNLVIDKTRNSESVLPRYKDLFCPVMDEAYDLLPKDLQEKYRDWERLEEQWYSEGRSSITAVEDREEMSKRLEAARNTFKMSLAKELNLPDISEEDSQVERLYPDEGAKDWNDLLLFRLRNDDEEDEERKLAAGIDLNNDGELEVSECNEEKKTKNHHR